MVPEPVSEYEHPVAVPAFSMSSVVKPVTLWEKTTLYEAIESFRGVEVALEKVVTFGGGCPARTGRT